MLEPEIKYESCEEIYGGPAVMNNSGHSQMRENEDGINAGVGVENGPEAVCQKRNYIEHMQSLAVCGDPNAQPEPYGANNYNNMTSSMNAHNYYVMQQQQPLPTGDPVKKRPRRYETNILFQHPFFNLLEDWDSARTGEAITAKCLSCKVTLRGHKNVSSNFIKHMKRLHPELYKVYESYKILKYAPTDTVGGGQVGGEQSFFDASAFLEHMANTTGEEQTSTETSSTPPTEGVDTGEYNVCTQETDPAKATSAGNVRLVSQEKILDPKQSRSEVDLSAKTLAQMSQLLDSKLSGFVTIAQLQEERKTIINMMDCKLEETLNPSQTDNASSVPTVASTINATESVNGAMQAQIDALKAECDELRGAVKRAQQSKQHMQAELQAIDRAVRQNKLFIRNAMLMNSEKPIQTVERILRDMLQLPDVQVKNVIPLASQTNRLKSNLMVELHKSDDTQAILRNCGKLKNTGIMIETALGPHALRRKHKLLVLRRELLRRNAQLKVLVRNTQLFVGGKEFYWDVVDGLGVAQNQLDDVVDTDNDVVEVLNETTGLEMKEFLNVLKNYNVN